MRLLSAVLPHLPLLGQAMSWVQPLASSKQGRGCVAAIFFGYRATLSLLTKGSQSSQSNVPRSTDGPGAAHTYMEPEGEREQEEDEEEAVRCAIHACTQSWQAIHSQDQHWSHVHPRYKIPLYSLVSFSGTLCSRSCPSELVVD